MCRFTFLLAIYHFAYVIHLIYNHRSTNHLIDSFRPRSRLTHLLFAFSHFLLLFTFALVLLHLFSAARRKNNLASLWSFRFHIAWAFVSFRFFYLYFVFNFHSISFSLSLSSRRVLFFRIFLFLFLQQARGGAGIRGQPLSNPWVALREIASVVQTFGALFNLPLRQCAPFIQSTFRHSPSSVLVSVCVFECVRRQTFGNAGAIVQPVFRLDQI